MQRPPHAVSRIRVTFSGGRLERQQNWGRTACRLALVYVLVPYRQECREATLAEMSCFRPVPRLSPGSRARSSHAFRIVNLHPASPRQSLLQVHRRRRTLLRIGFKFQRRVFTRVLKAQRQIPTICSTLVLY